MTSEQNRRLMVAVSNEVVGPLREQLACARKRIKELEVVMKIDASVIKELRKIEKRNQP